MQVKEPLAPPPPRQEQRCLQDHSAIFCWVSTPHKVARGGFGRNTSPQLSHRRALSSLDAPGSLLSQGPCLKHFPTPNLPNSYSSLTSHLQCPFLRGDFLTPPRHLTYVYSIILSHSTRCLPSWSFKLVTACWGCGNVLRAWGQCPACFVPHRTDGDSAEARISGRYCGMRVPSISHVAPRWPHSSPAERKQEGHSKALEEFRGQSQCRL